MPTYIERLNLAIRTKQTPALVGLDPRMDQLPAEILERARQASPDKRLQMATAYEEFCVRVIDVVAPLVPAVKPQVAFFEECGPDGMEALNTVMRHARKRGLIVIADAKRGDIGSTAEGYAAAAGFQRFEKRIELFNVRRNIHEIIRPEVDPIRGIQTLE